jgi:excisionase family DNA binding protein
MKNVPRIAATAIPQQHGRSPETPGQTPSMLTITDVCQRLQISRRQVYRCVNRGQLPAPIHRLGRKAAWPTSAIEQLEAAWTAESLAELSRRQQANHRPL